MTRLFRLGTTTALVTVMASPLSADVTATDVWGGFVTIYQAVGLKIDATEARSVNRLSISNLKLSADFPFDLGSVAITTTGFDLIENGDGTVSIKAPDNIPFAMALTLPDDIFATATMDYRLNDYSALISGDPDKFSVVSSVGTAVIEVTSLNVTGPEALKLDFDIKLNGTIRDIESEATFTSGTLLGLAQNVSYGEMKISGAFTAQSTDTSSVESTFTTTMTGMKSSSTMAIPATGIDLMNLPAQLREGMVFQATSQMQGQTSKQRVTTGGELLSDQTATVDDSITSVRFSKDGLSIAGQSNGYAIDYVMKELPFPIQLSFSSLAAKMDLPLLKSDSEQGFVYMLNFNGITMADGLWGQFDPTSELPRDPARMMLDLSGKGRLFYDLLDIDAMRGVIDEGLKFGELTSLDLNNLDITAIGARLIGNGAFTFDNSNLNTFSNLPAPSGTATFHMSGLNGVMDTLVQIGLLENDAAFGVRMGLGLFAVAGDGADTLTSEIEVTPDGHITANGKRLK